MHVVVFHAHIQSPLHTALMCRMDGQMEATWKFEEYPSLLCLQAFILTWAAMR